MSRNELELRRNKVVRFYLTNQWHFGIIGLVGRKWVHINYKKSGKMARHKIPVSNINTDIKEV